MEEMLSAIDELRSTAKRAAELSMQLVVAGVARDHQRCEELSALGLASVLLLREIALLIDEPDSVGAITATAAKARELVSRMNAVLIDAHVDASPVPDHPPAG